MGAVKMRLGLIELPKIMARLRPVEGDPNQWGYWQFPQTC